MENKNSVKLALKNLTKKYKNGDGVENVVLEVMQGELVTLLGPSGCGKTTILRIIGGFLQPDAGEVLLDGKNISGLSPEKRPTAMVFQNYNLWPHMTVFDNLAFGLKLRRMNRETIRQQIREVLELVKMPDVEKKYPAQLSGGQQQRIAIARAILLKPSLLLLDEPFSALDAKIREQMREEIKRIQQDLGITIVFVTHDQEEAMSISHRIVVMNKGFIEQSGSPAKIYDEPRTIFVARFIGNMNFIESSVSREIIAVRPENLMLGKPEQADFTGRIASMTILGHYIDMKIDSEKGNVKAYVSRTEAEDYRVGDQVGLSVGRHCIFSADECSALS